MSITTLHVINPVDRFRRIAAELGADQAWPVDRAWWRYAAQAAVLRPADPADTANAIRSTLAELRTRCGWSDSIQAPFGQMVAAVLVQIGDTPEAFLDDLVAMRRMLHEAGLPHSNWYELKAVLALRALSDGAPVATPPTVRRLRDIFDRMRSYHWWLTGRDDLPTCALLSACPGDPSAIADSAEAIYQELARTGVSKGEQLQAAANILPLAGIEPATITHRYLEVSLAITEAGLPRDETTYPIEAMLALLDHTPSSIAARLASVHDQLVSNDPVVAATDLSVAADLCFIDLVRMDHHHRLRTAENEVDAVHTLIRRQRALAVVTAEVPPTPAIPYGVAPWMRTSTGRQPV